MKILRFLATFVLVLGMAAQVSSTPVEKDGLEFTYFGAAGWKITDGAITVLVDPYISRLQYTDRSLTDVMKWETGTPR
jgi:hypothetical protein